MVSGSLISCDSSTKLWTLPHYGSVSPNLPKALTSHYFGHTHPLLCVFGCIVRLKMSFYQLLFVIGIHLRRHIWTGVVLLGPVQILCTLLTCEQMCGLWGHICSSWPGSNTVMSKCVGFANMRQRLPSNNSIGSGHKPLSDHLETLKLCLNTSKPPETQVWNTWTVFEHRLPSQSIQSSSPPSCKGIVHSVAQSLCWQTCSFRMVDGFCNAIILLLKEVYISSKYLVHYEVQVP